MLRRASGAPRGRAAQPCARMVARAARIRPPAPGYVEVSTNAVRTDGSDASSAIALSLTHAGHQRNWVRPADEDLRTTVSRIARNISKEALLALPKKERKRASLPEGARASARDARMPPLPHRIAHSELTTVAATVHLHLDSTARQSLYVF